MKINEAAKMTGVTIRTLHYYDQIGLLRPETVTDAGYRLYGEKDMERLSQILFFRELDFPLSQIKEMLDVCTDSYRYALDSLVEQSKEKAFRVIEKETQADDLEISLRSKHIKRLTNNQCNTEAGIVFLDSLVCLERISDHARNIAEEVLEDLT